MSIILICTLLFGIRFLFHEKNSAKKTSDNSYLYICRLSEDKKRIVFTDKNGNRKTEIAVNGKVLSDKEIIKLKNGIRIYSSEEFMSIREDYIE